MRRFNWPHTLGERCTTSCRNLVSRPTLLYFTLLYFTLLYFTYFELFCHRRRVDIQWDVCHSPSFWLVSSGSQSLCAFRYLLASDFVAVSLVVITDETNMFLSALICSPLLILSLPASNHLWLRLSMFQAGVPSCLFIHLDMCLPRDSLPQTFIAGGGGNVCIYKAR